MVSDAELNLQGFQSVAFEFDQIHVRGGFMSKPMPVASKKIDLHGGGDENGQQAKTFVKFNRQQAWLIAAVTGHRRIGHVPFGCNSLIDILHEKVELVANGELQSCSSDGVPHGGGDDAADDYDPMNMVDVSVEEQEKFETPTKVSGGGSKRHRYYRNVAKGNIVYINVPECTAEEDPTQREQRMIALYIEDRKTVWLELRDVAWAVRFLYVQSKPRGVPEVQADDDGPGGGPHRGDGEPPSASNPKRARISESPIRGHKKFQRKKSFCVDEESQVVV